MMLSYWEQKNFLDYDLIVVGAGFTGLSTAIHFKKNQPKSKVLVLERGVFPTGASTKNAGFACFGSLTEILDDFWVMSPDEVVQLVERRYEGLRQIRKHFGDKVLRYQHRSGYEILDESNLSALDRLPDTNRLLKKVFKDEVFSIVKKPGKFGFSEKVKAVVKNKFEGELDPGAYLGALWHKASKLGITILTGLTVVEVDPEQGRVVAENKEKSSGFEFSAGKVAVCTNAFTKKLWTESPLEPGRGLILLSKPLHFDLPWKGAFHMDKGYVYFREVDGRLLLGGARNKDFENEKSTEFSVNPSIKAHLDQLAKEVIFPYREFEWEMEWTGIMAFGPKKTPVIQQIGNKTAVAVRLGGMGVAIGWQVGKELAALLSEM
ncbi:glycine/D-amino acid oxidase-like deaminating enzyme [Algoriphagus aquaeductus]|uniref:Glycine/D-amino acid oxidase-like deaminating enzyme n=1 Tax=Algoriphagus aquaeductus TaxID=475299 RepID=A0A326RVM7_9BACT|nr:FAD-dependent oxidoreductase [Algoriphagus aquaeductus]PZV85461.1 glycine/D-amino acid oxidase-like deaminating enzyme [Algoriphagus aquaeductus]